MKLSEFNYILPQELIAQHPLEEREKAKLMVLNKKTGSIAHHKFCEIATFFKEGDMLLINNTRVIKARLKGHKETGGKIEILLIREIEKKVWEAMISHAKRTKAGTKLLLDKNIYATIAEKKGSRCHLVFNSEVQDIIRKYGIVPLPHYIKRDTVKKDEEHYQTVFAKEQGSIAAPTAGLHFTDNILKKIINKNTIIAEITLHIGPGTFRPIRAENIEDHDMESEYFEISQDVISKVKQVRRVFGVGTSVCRAIETFAQTGKADGCTDLFIYPGHVFKMIDCLITNFHLPCSTPLLLVCAFAGKDLIFKAYREAIEKKYRFLSYGDAMLII